jgi:hypothetical protein
MLGIAVILSLVVASSSSPLDCLRQYYPQTLYDHDSYEYRDTIAIDNSRAEVLPLAVVMPTSDTSVACALNAARACGIPFSVISGGHSAQGYGLSRRGLTINIRHLNSTKVTWQGGEAVLTVGAGARYRNVYEATHRAGGLVPVGGGCPDVGVAGFVLGGGWSFLSRSYGLAIDTLLRVRLVLPNGTAVDVSASSPDAELWWALRGGGGGNFGVATEFDMRLFQPENRSSVGQMCWPQASPAVMPIMEAWLQGFAAMPNWLNLDPCWLPLGLNGTRMFCLTTVCNNVPELCQPLINRFKEIAAPTLDTVKVSSVAQNN